MSKDTYYFSHDYNARNDRKIAALVKDYKASGYGVFWATCEMMHEEGGELEVDDITYSAIAKDLNEEVEYVKTVIEKCITSYKLFKMNNLRLNSGRVERNLNKRNDISEKRRKAAIAKHMHANAEQVDANAMQNGAKKGKKGNKINKENNGNSFFSPVGDEIQKANSIDKATFMAKFSDGSSQLLGPDQIEMFNRGQLSPQSVIKNHSY